MVAFTRLASCFVVAGLLVAAFPAAAGAQTGSDPYFEFLMARRLESQGDAAGALAALQRAATLDTASASIRAEIAAFQMRRNRRDEAEKAARESLALDKDNADAHRVLGLIYFARTEATDRVPPGDLAANIREAITHLEVAAGSLASASDINLFYTLGRLYMRSRDTEKAVQALTRVVNLNPDSMQGRLALAQAYMSADNLDAAIMTLQEIDADDPRVPATLGQYLEQAGRPADAVGEYTKALALAPTNRELKFRRVAALFNAKQFVEAATMAAEAQQQHPDDLRFLRIRAQALVLSGSSARAVDVMEPAARANPRDGSMQLALADLYTSAGRPNDAEHTVRQFLMLVPENADALNYLGYLLADRGQQLDEAIRLVRKALDLDPDNPSFLDSMGWAYYHRGDIDLAEKYLAPAAEKLPGNAVIQDHMGDVLAKRGKWQAAIDAWTRALSAEGGDINRSTVQKKIDEARVKVRR